MISGIKRFTIYASIHTFMIATFRKVQFFVVMTSNKRSSSFTYNTCSQSTIRVSRRFPQHRVPKGERYFRIDRFIRTSISCDPHLFNGVTEAGCRNPYSCTAAGETEQFRTGICGKRHLYGHSYYAIIYANSQRKRGHIDIFD